MEESTEKAITGILRGLQHGDRDRIEELVHLVEQDLRGIARQRLNGERDGHSMDSGDLVNEFWVRLLSGTPREWRDGKHFRAAASRAMRNILVDHARAHRRKKRGGKRQRVDLSALEHLEGHSALSDVTYIDELMSDLAAEMPQAAQMLEMWVYGGLDKEQIAEDLGVHPRTVQRQLRAARQWFQRLS